ncbi:MAG: hotdog family protein [Thiopseudomonas sp.]|nr:hotdog family protein [Gammaproteobacteria bacterium]
MNWPLAELLPHAGDMILLDSVEHWDEDSILARCRVRDSLFSQPDGSWPAWLGIELMAQAVAAYAGLRAKSSGGQVQLGFLLGTRKYECAVSSFAAGAELEVSARRSLEDDSGMGVFECEIRSAGISLHARLNVYRPTDPDSFIKETTP